MTPLTYEELHEEIEILEARLSFMIREYVRQSLPILKEFRRLAYDTQGKTGYSESLARMITFNLYTITRTDSRVAGFIDMSTGEIYQGWDSSKLTTPMSDKYIVQLYIQNPGTFDINGFYEYLQEASKRELASFMDREAYEEYRARHAHLF